MNPNVSGRKVTLARFRRAVLCVLLLLALHPCSGLVAEQTSNEARIQRIFNTLPGAVLRGLASGQPQKVIVQFDSRTVAAEAAAMRAKKGIIHDDGNISEFKSQRFREIKRIGRCPDFPPPMRIS